MDTGYSLKQVLAIAKVHPFYNPGIKYPPTQEEVIEIANSIDKNDNDGVNLSALPLATKETLYPTINRLWADDSPENSYRKAAYLSVTGGGSGGKPMLFATDVFENRRHRAAAATLLRTCGVVEPGDVVFSVHACGYLYRALDLMTELFEMAGGAVLCGGLAMQGETAIEHVINLRANVFAGDGSQVLAFANLVASLPAERREKVKVNKVIYTSDALTRDQRKIVSSVLDAKICSVNGSCEAGAWSTANFSITGEPDEDGVDFIYDTRMMVVEILPPLLLDEAGAGAEIRPVPDGEKGIMVQTSLSRLRNPLIRYITGDLASTRPFPATDEIPEEVAQHLRVIRLYGRDRRFSFKWYGEYFEFHKVKALIQQKGWGVLQYQIVLENLSEKETLILTVRLYRSDPNAVQPGEEAFVSNEEIVKGLKQFFIVFEENGNENDFKVEFVKDLDGFERSKTGNKVMNFVDRSKH
ncbi:uncharacterized protein DFL_007934 [Arthrobotrys flagrans]|uniref:AMP-dependent synthetase/ligase domain-containing protein n=1 Tax=Arthrobotrys flagrans TaxID=97331 RepID=A0A436ZXC4_ARTFL|nr:hypothetical protein DFL_007934 [Arthrobotrys flagrans]